MARISVVDLSFFGFHGCHPLEQKVGGTFMVDVHVDGDFSKAYESDLVEDAVDYVTIMNIAKEQMSIRCNLIESVAKNIADALSKALPVAERIEVKVKKMQPPLDYELGYVSTNYIVERGMNK